MRPIPWHPSRAAFAVLAIGLVTALITLAGCCRPGGPPPATQPLAPAATVPPADLLEGDWAGQWTSTSNDMSGALRCHIARQPTGDYQATFDATFAEIFNHHSVITLKLRDPDPDRQSAVWSFKGQEDLGILAGGVYTYDGQSNGEEFSCTYDSEWDKGTFKMRRGSPATRP